MTFSPFHSLQGPNSEVRYSIQSVNPPSGLNLFYIFPEDGRIMVSRPLTADRENSRYVVRNPRENTRFFCASAC